MKNLIMKHFAFSLFNIEYIDKTASIMTQKADETYLLAMNKDWSAAAAKAEEIEKIWLKSQPYLNISVQYEETENIYETINRFRRDIDVHNDKELEYSYKTLVNTLKRLSEYEKISLRSIL